METPNSDPAQNAPAKPPTPAEERAAHRAKMILYAVMALFIALPLMLYFFVHGV